MTKKSMVAEDKQSKPERNLQLVGCLDTVLAVNLLTTGANIGWLKGIQGQWQQEKDTRLLTGYFPPSKFVKDGFWKDESIIFGRKALYQKFDFWKTSIQVDKRHLKKKHHLRRILQQVCHVYRYCKNSKFKFLFQKTPYSFKNTKFGYLLDTVSCILQQIVYKLVKKNSNSELDVFSWRVNVKKNARVEWQFFFHSFI